MYSLAARSRPVGLWIAVISRLSRRMRSTSICDAAAWNQARCSFEKSGCGMRLMAPMAAGLPMRDLPGRIIDFDRAVAEFQPEPGRRAHIKGQHAVVGVLPQRQPDLHAGGLAAL